MNGIINLNKPEGMTSHKAVSIARHLLGIKKIGHTGTLDPMVTGVLPLCVGAATRLTEYMDQDYKVYEGELLLGLRTDTQDIWGKTLQEDPEAADKLTEEQIQEVLKSFKGEILQTPPSFSAVRISGRRMYEYARSGELIQARPRRVHIRRLEIHDIQGARVRFLVECSKGTYIRTICADAGERLGCGGAMSALTRTQSGRFELKDAISIQALEREVNNLTLRLLPMDFPLPGYGSIRIREKEAAVIFSNGGFLEREEADMEKAPAQEPSDKEQKFYKAYYNGIFIGMAEWHQETQKLKAHKIFCRCGF